MLKNIDYKISVLIPVYGTEKYIEQCSISLFSNTLASDCEFIFVNDQTKDNSMNILRHTIELYPHLSNNIKIINHTQNMGLAEARNTGIQNATGKYIICVDSDDWVEPDYLEQLWNKAIETDADIVTCNFIEEDKNKKRFLKQSFNHSKENIYKDLLSDKIRAFVWCKLVKRSLFFENDIRWKKGINMFEDLYINSQLFFVAKSFSTVDKYLYHYRISNTSSIVHQKTLSNFKQMFEVLIFISEFLKKNNSFDLYKKVFIYRVTYIKMTFSMSYLYTTNEYNSLFSHKERKFMLKNIFEYSLLRKIYILLLLLHFYHLLSFLIFIKSKKDYKMYMHYSEILENLDFLHSCDI